MYYDVSVLVMCHRGNIGVTILSVDCIVLATPSPMPRTPVAASSRSARTNGSPFLGRVDRRSAAARRHRDLERAFAADLGGQLTTTQRITIGQAAALTVRAELLQAAIARGDPVDGEELIRVANTLERLFTTLGLKGARAPSEQPNLQDYLAAQRGSAP